LKNDEVTDFSIFTPTLFNSDFENISVSRWNIGYKKPWHRSNESCYVFR